MGSPSPVPSRQRAWLESTWPKGVSATAMSSSLMPTPVSQIVHDDAAVGSTLWP